MRVKQTPHSRERGGDQVQLVLFMLDNDGPGARWPGQNIVNIRPDAVLSTNSLHQPAAGGRSPRSPAHTTFYGISQAETWEIRKWLFK